MHRNYFFKKPVIFLLAMLAIPCLAMDGIEENSTFLAGLQYFKWRWPTFEIEQSSLWQRACYPNFIANAFGMPCETENSEKMLRVEEAFLQQYYFNDNLHRCMMKNFVNMF